MAKYEISWKSGATETVEADSVTSPKAYRSEKGFTEHVRFFKDMGLVLSVDESLVNSIRKINTRSGFVTKKFDRDTIEIEERWLKRAKELLKTYGQISSMPLTMLGQEMSARLYDSLPSKIIVVARRELNESGYFKTNTYGF